MFRNSLLLAIASLCIPPLFAHDIAASIVGAHCEDELETCCVFMQYLDQTDNGATIQYLYDAEGRKLEVTHTPPALSPSSQMTTDYCDNVIYKDGALERILTDEGYITIAANNTPAYHYYLHDHLGSVRVVLNSSGTVEETTHYYPYGALFPQTPSQPYKFCGKELDRMHGLDWYDSQARMYDPVLNRWHTQDSKTENFYSWSPYAYCMGNPVNYVDPDGKDYWSTNDREQIEAFLGTIHKGLSHFDFSGWQHATDAEITGKLTYNDITHKYYTSYSDVIDGQITVVGLSFDANITPVSHSGIGYPGAFVNKPLSGFWQKLDHYLNGTKYYDGYFTWDVNEDGRIIGMAPLTGTPPIVSLAGKSGMLIKYASKLGRKTKMGRPIGKMSGNRAVQKEQIDALCNKYGIHGTKRQELHRMIGHQGLDYHEIEELILDLFY